MRRSALAVIVFVVLAGAGVVSAALLGAFRSDLGEYGAVFLVDRDGAGLGRLTHDHRFHGYTWSPDGRWIAMATRSVDAHGIDVRGPLELTEVATGDTRELDPRGFVSEFAWRSNGALALLVTGSHSHLADSRIEYASVTGILRYGASVGRIGAAAWSPRGTALAVVSCEGGRRRPGVDILSSGGHLVRRLGRLPGSLPEGACSDPDAAGELLWSPDGRALYAPLSNGLWRFSRDGGAPRRIVAEEPLEPSVSPDGRTLVFGLSRTPSGDTGEQLYVLSVSGGHPRLLNSEFAAAPAFSPDGKLIAFVPRDREEIETVPLSGGAAAGLTPFPAAKTEVCCLTWSPTGKQLAFDASAKRSES